MAKDNKSYGKPQAPPSDEKTFSLKEIELKMIEVLQQSYFMNLSNYLSYLALERLAYPVTANTQFKVEQGKLYIHEKPTEPPAAEPPQEVSTA